MEAVQRASNGLDLISHSSRLFLNKVQRNTIILGCRRGVGGSGGRVVLPRRSSSRGGWRGRAREALPVSGKRCPQAAADAAIPGKPSPPAPARTSPLRRGKPRPGERAARGAIAARPNHLRRARGLSSGLARGSCPRVPSGTAPHLSALPVTSWKPRCPRPGGREGGRRLREAAPGGSGRRRGGSSRGSSRWLPSVERGGPAAGPAPGCSSPAGASAQPGPAPYAGGCGSYRALPFLAPACGAPLPGGHGGGARRAVGVELRWVSVGMGWDGLAASLAGASSAREESVVLAPRVRLPHPAGSESAHGCWPGAAAGAAPSPAEPPPASPCCPWVSGRAVTASRGCSEPT